MSSLRRAWWSALPLLWAAAAWAEEVPQPPRRPFWVTFLYWLGAVVLMIVVALRLFREQLHERRTLRKMIDELGPYFPEFDIEVVVQWVHRTAPHVWNGWRVGDFQSLGDFGTADFHAQGQALFDEDARRGWARDVRLEKVLKVHPLGFSLEGAGPPPKDVELVLRVEQRAVDLVRGPDGAVVEGEPGSRQVQHIWTLRHDGRRWRLHAVVPAVGDINDLDQRPPLPPLMEWKRPPDPGREES